MLWLTWRPLQPTSSENLHMVCFKGIGVQISRILFRAESALSYVKTSDIKVS